MAFTLCLNTSTIKPVPLIEKIELTARHGFAGIEPWINDVYEYVGRGGEVRDVEKAVADCGLIVPCTIALRGWGEAIDEEYPVMLDECRRRMELAARLGSPYIVATPPRVPCPLEQITRRYGDLLEIGRQAGVRPIMEYISFFRSVYRLDQAWKVVQDVADRDAMVLIDSFHTWNGGSTPDDLEAVDAARIAHYHFDDAAPDRPQGTQTDADRVMPGDGPIDLAAEVAVLREKGYQGAVSLELFNKELWCKDPNEVLKIGIERMRHFLKG